MATKPAVKKPAVKKPAPQVEPSTLQAVDEIIMQEVVEIELIPKFKEAEIKKSQQEALAEQNQELIKTLRIKLADGTISDGEAQELFTLLS